MNTAVPSKSTASLDQVLGAVKQTHQLLGCRTCGLMSTFAEPVRASSAAR
jgi:hypothetical protein